MSHSAHHCSSHMHAHGDATSGMDDTGRLTIALFIILGFAVIEVIGAAISGSLALLADAGHMVTDGVAIGLALVARKLAERRPTKQFQFGQHRAQVLAAFVNGLALFVLIAFLLSESIRRIASPQSIDAGVMMAVAVLGLLANIAAFAVLHRGSAKDVNVRGAMLHVVGDLLGSVAAIISAIVILTTGWLVVDALVTLAVCALIGHSAWGLIRETGIVLLEGAPDNIDRDVLAAEAKALPHVSDIDDIKVWMITPEKPQVTMQVRVDDPQCSNEALRAIERLLAERFGVEESTIQIEFKGLAVKNNEGPKSRLTDPNVSSSTLGEEIDPTPRTIH